MRVIKYILGTGAALAMCASVANGHIMSAHQRKTYEALVRDDGSVPPRSIIQYWMYRWYGVPNLNGATIQFGSLLQATYGPIPAGTTIYPVRIWVNGSVNYTVYFWQDSFGDWYGRMINMVF